MLPLELRHLRYFLHLAEEKSFVRAAKNANVSQSSMTEQMQRLEDILGVTLIDRDRRHVALTPAGELLERKARELLRGAHELIEETRVAGGIVRRQLRIGYSEMALGSPMPEITRAFRQLHPGVKLFVSHQSSIASDKALMEDKLDILFVPSLSKIAAFETLKLGDEAVLACLPDNLDLGGAEAMSPFQFRDLPLILPMESSRFAERVATAFAQADIRPNIVSRISRVTSMLTLVASGEACCFIPGSFSGIIPRGVVALPFCDPNLTVPFSLVWRKEPRNLAVEWFVNVAREVLGRPSVLRPEVIRSDLNRTSSLGSFPAGAREPKWKTEPL